jgi:hypothetical protein
MKTFLDVLTMLTTISDLSNWSQDFELSGNIWYRELKLCLNGGLRVQSNGKQRRASATHTRELLDPKDYSSTLGRQSSISQPQKAYAV